MTTLADKDRSHESIINDTLARFLRERCGLSAVAETLHGGKRPDIIARLPEGPVILETELEPALTVEADALSRLGMEIDGQRIQNVFAITVPGRLRSTGQQRLYERMAVATLAWQEWRIDGTCGPKLSGSATELGNAVARTTPPVGNLEEALTEIINLKEDRVLVIDIGPADGRGAEVVKTLGRQFKPTPMEVLVV